MNDNLFNPDDYIREEYKSAKPYRPSNGSEGESFMSIYCDRCIKGDIDEEENHCIIFHNTWIYDVIDENYPKEWAIGPRGPECLVFKEKN